MNLPMKQPLSFRISADKTIKTDKAAFIAGIINVTPDSFCPVGKCPPEENIVLYAEQAAQTALKFIADGASVLDIGAESTGPGSVPISEEEELKRLIPALKAIRKVTDCPVSIDTTKAAVMKAALEEGADILNDVSALTHDKMMANVCRDAEIPVILMHNHDIMDVGIEDTPEAVSAFLAERVLYAMQNGIAPEKLILDAGIGFGKTYEQNLCLITCSEKIRQGVLKRTGLENTDILPVMMALSRKRCIGAMTGRDVEQRLSGTLAANLLAVQGGATFVRVHDVAETQDMLSVLNALDKE